MKILNCHLKILLVLILLSAKFNIVYSQRIDTALQIYAQRFQPEMVYFQLDKDIYFPGDTIWFKGYLFSGFYPSNWSKTIYVDFFDKNGHILTHATYPIINAGTSGQYVLPNILQGHSIYMRAYTKWMLNFDSCSLYSKPIPIYNEIKQLNTKDSAQIFLKFFPEGGKIITGINNNVAFKANDQKGNPLDTKGAIYDNLGNFVVDIESTHDGMGHFYLFPETGKSFIARCTIEKRKVDIPLPHTHNEGVGIQIKQQNQKILFQINKPSTSLESSSSVHLIAVMHQKLLYQKDYMWKDGSTIEGIIDNTQLPTGILQIIIFDQGWMPLAERICFVSHLRKMESDADLHLEKEYVSKDSSNLIIDLRKQQLANISLSITDASFPEYKTDNIRTYLLLTGQLQEQIYRPDYYLKETSPKIQNDLDLVMLTHYLRYNNWQCILQNKYPSIPYSPDTTYLHLSGKIQHYTSKQKDTSEKILLFIKPIKNDEPQRISSYVANVAYDGSFQIPDLVFVDSLGISYQLINGHKTKNSTVLFMPDKQFRVPNPCIEDLNEPIVSYQPVIDSMLSNLWRQKQRIAERNSLQPIIVSTRQKSLLDQMDDKYTTGLFRGGEGTKIDVNRCN